MLPDKRILTLSMRYFENLKSGGKSVLNTYNNNDNYPSCVDPESVVLESSAKPSQGCQFCSPNLVWQKIKEPPTPDNHNRMSYTLSLLLHYFIPHWPLT